MSNVKDLEKKIKVNFTNHDLLQQAMVHRSYINEHLILKCHNERLDFSDACFRNLVTEYLYKNFPVKLRRI
jgi:ribonuclease-3